MVCCCIIAHCSVTIRLRLSSKAHCPYILFIRFSSCMAQKAKLKKQKYIPKPSDLVPAPEYDTDDSFDDSKRREVTSFIERKRLESGQASLAVILARRNKIGPCIDIRGKRIEFKRYADRLMAQTMAAFNLQGKVEAPKKPRMPRRRSKELDEEYEPSEDSDFELPNLQKRKAPRRSPRQPSKRAKTSTPLAGTAAVDVNFDLSEPEQEEEDVDVDLADDDDDFEPDPEGDTFMF